MRLFEAILEANHRAVAGDASAGVHPGEFGSELPVVALTCVDPRLNFLFPNVLAIPAEQFIWLRNAGNVITGPMSSTMRSLALACAVKGGKEIAIIGHTDCQVGHTTTMQLIDRLKALGIERHVLPDNLTEFFGIFGSERQNVIKSADFVRRSPLIGPAVPVHGLMVDVRTGKLEWIVNGYQTLDTAATRLQSAAAAAGRAANAFAQLADFKIGEIKFPETKIGETVTKAAEWVAKEAQAIASPEVLAVPEPPTPGPTPPPVPPRKIPLPPPIRPRIHLQRGPRR